MNIVPNNLKNLTIKKSLILNIMIDFFEIIMKSAMSIDANEHLIKTFKVSLLIVMNCLFLRIKNSSEQFTHAEIDVAIAKPT